MFPWGASHFHRRLCVCSVSYNCSICAPWADSMSGCGRLTARVIAIMLPENAISPIITFQSGYLSSWPQESAISYPIGSFKLTDVFWPFKAFYWAIRARQTQFKCTFPATCPIIRSHRATLAGTIVGFPLGGKVWRCESKLDLVMRKDIKQAVF